MLLLTALLMVAPAAAEAEESAGRGAEIATARVQAVILEAAKVRQGTGHEKNAEGPAPQITRRAGEVLVEFQ